MMAPVLTNQRIKSAEYDVVLQSQKESLPDVIFEIKYVKGFRINWVRESVKRLILATELLQQFNTPATLSA